MAHNPDDQLVDLCNTQAKLIAKLREDLNREMRIAVERQSANGALEFRAKYWRERTERCTQIITKLEDEVHALKVERDSLRTDLRAFQQDMLRESLLGLKG